MALGAPRENNQPEEILRPVSDEVSTRLRTALTRMDSVDPAFKRDRDDERNSQLSKQWNKQSKEINTHLNALAKSLVRAHQLSLEVGSEGGGRAIRPWVGETSMRFDRLYLSLHDGDVVATYRNDEIDRVPRERVTYEWLEQTVVDWVVRAVEEASVEVVV